MRILKKILSTCLAAIVITGEIVSPGLTVISSAGIENTGAKDGVTETLSRERVSEKTDSAQKTIDFNDYNFTYTKENGINTGKKDKDIDYLEELLKDKNSPYDLMIKFKYDDNDSEISLKERADNSQKEAVAIIEAALKRGEVEKYQSFYISNAIHIVTGSKELLKELAGLDKVEKIVRNSNVELIEPVEKEKKSRRKKRDTIYTPDERDIEWGVIDVHADKVWEDFGVDGSGITVGIIDTGVNYNLPAIKRSFLDYDAASDKIINKVDNPATKEWEGPSYRDFVGNSSSPEVSEANDHGTHVAGTILGRQSDNLNRIGVAPGAKFVSARAIGPDGGQVADLLAAAQWMLEVKPDVVNNSWGGPNDNDGWFKDIIVAWNDAGIIPVFAAGNTSGKVPGLGTISNPGNYLDVISVAAVDHNKRIGSFSNKGPSAFDSGKSIIKPELSAPGVQVRSIDAKGTYVSWNGTSMAAPHVTGVIALVKDAAKKAGREKDFDTMEEIRTLLISTAEPLSDNTYSKSPNMAYGYGLVNAYDAVAQVMGREQGQISGVVLKDGADTRVPELEIESLDEAYIGRKLKISAKASDDISIREVKLSYYIGDDASKAQKYDMELASGRQNDGIYSFTIEADKLKKGSLHLSISIKDYAGNETVKNKDIEIKSGMGLPWSADFENGAASLNGFILEGSWAMSQKKSSAEPDLPPSADGSTNTTYIGINAGSAGFDKRIDSYLYLPPIDLSSVSGTPSLSVDMYNGFSGITQAKLQASFTGDENDWEDLYQVVLRPDITERKWEHNSFSLEKFIGKDKPLQLRFYFFGHSADEGPGWYLDNLSIKRQENVPPAQVQGLSAKNSQKGLKLSFIANEESDMSGYVIERKEENAASFTQISTIAQELDKFQFINKGEDPKRPASHYRVNYYDKDLESGKNYIYRVRAYDKTGNYSQYSVELRVEYKAYDKTVFYDFENDNGGFESGTLSGIVNDWEWGKPVRPGSEDYTKLLPRLTWEGLEKNDSKVWGTKLNGKLSTRQDSYLLMPSVDINDNSYLYFDSFNAQSSVSNAISFTVDIKEKNKNTWSQLVSREDIMNDDQIRVWQQLEANLSAYRGKTADIRFHVSVVGNIYMDSYNIGWYIDNVTVGQKQENFETDRAGLFDYSNENKKIPKPETATNSNASIRNNSENRSMPEQENYSDEKSVVKSRTSVFLNNKIKKSTDSNAESDVFKDYTILPDNELSDFDNKASELGNSVNNDTQGDNAGIEIDLKDGKGRFALGTVPIPGGFPSTSYIPLRARVKVLDTGKYTYASEIDGSYNINHSINEGNKKYKVEFSSYGYQTQVVEAALNSQNHQINLPTVVLKPAKTASVKGNVKDGSGQPLEGVNIRLVEDYKIPVLKSNGEGGYSTDSIFEGNYTFRFYKEGYFTLEKEVKLSEGENILDDVILTPFGDLNSETVDYGYNIKQSADGNYQTVHFTSGMKGAAVKFQSPHKGGILKSAEIFMVNNRYYSGSHIMVGVIAYDSKGRLREIAPFREYENLVPNTWNTIDFSEFTIKTDKPLYIAVMYTKTLSESMGVYYDTSADDNAKLHSFVYDGAFTKTTALNPSGAYAIKSNWLYSPQAAKNEEADTDDGNGKQGDIDIIVDTEDSFIFDVQSRTITGYKGNSTTVSIPAVIKGTPVEKIGKQAFIGTNKGDRKIKKVIIPEGIVEIGEEAFKNNNLSEIILPESVNSVGAGAFMYQYKDGMDDKSFKIMFPSGITRIERDTFTAAGNPVTAQLPSVRYIAKNAFNANRDIEINAPVLETIEDEAFGKYDRVDFNYARVYTAEDSVLISKDAQYLINPATVNINMINARDHEDIIKKQVYYGSGPTLDLSRNIPASRFYRTGSTTQIKPPRVIRNKTAYISGSPVIDLKLKKSNEVNFEYYEQAVRTRLPILDIDRELVGFTLPNAQIKLEINDRVYEFKANEDGLFKSDDIELKTGDNIKFNINSYDAGSFTVQAHKEGEEYIIEGSVIKRYLGTGGEITLPVSGGSSSAINEIADFAFYGNSLISVVLPDSLETIGSGAFMDTGLKSFGWNLKNINAGKLRTVNEYAFKNNSLTKVLLPELTHVIRTGAFENNDISEIKLGKYTGHIGDKAFKDNKIKELELADAAEEIGVQAFMNNSIEKLIVKPRMEGYKHGLDTIPQQAFANNKLKEVSLPREIISVSDTAFENNTDGRFIINSDAPEIIPTKGYDVRRSNGSILRWSDPDKKPDNPLKPDKPVNPAQPEKPDKPVQPENPVQPKQPDAPSLPDKNNIKPQKPDFSGGSYSSGGFSGGGSGSRLFSAGISGNKISALPAGYSGAERSIGRYRVPFSVNKGIWQKDVESKSWKYMDEKGMQRISSWIEIYNENLIGIPPYTPYAWYNFDEKGIMRTSWYTDEKGNTYYFSRLKDATEGMMLTGWQLIDGKWYYFDIRYGSDMGNMLKNSISPDGYRLTSDGSWDGIKN